MTILESMRELIQRKLTLEKEAQSEEIEARLEEINRLIKILLSYIDEAFVSQPELNQWVINEYYFLLNPWKDIMKKYEIDEKDIKHILLQFQIFLSKSDADFDID